LGCLVGLSPYPKKILSPNDGLFFIVVKSKYYARASILLFPIKIACFRNLAVWARKSLSICLGFDMMTDVCRTSLDIHFIAFLTEDCEVRTEIIGLTIPKSKEGADRAAVGMELYHSVGLDVDKFDSIVHDQV